MRHPPVPRCFLAALAAWTVSAAADPAPPPPDLPFAPADPAGSSPSGVPAPPPAAPANPAAPDPAFAEALKHDASRLAEGPALPPKPPAPKRAAPRRPASATPAMPRFPDPEPRVDQGVIRARPGATYRLAIARNRLNRIVTPFEEPKVLTASAVKDYIEGSAVYVGTASEEPVALYLAEAEGPRAVSLELLPRDGIAPVEVRVELESAGPGGPEPIGSGGAPAALADQPYVAALKATFKALALENLPQGFNLEPRPPSLAPCAQPGLGFSAGQLLTGAAADLLVLVAENRGASAVVLDETACAATGVLAVAAWPRIRLLPGERTEVYVALKRGTGRSDERRRPSLVERSR